MEKANDKMGKLIEKVEAGDPSCMIVRKVLQLKDMEKEEKGKRLGGRSVEKSFTVRSYKKCLPNFKVGQEGFESKNSELFGLNENCCTNTETLKRVAKEEASIVCGNINASNVSKFLSHIQQGPFYIRKCCNRMLYKKTVRKFDTDMYGIRTIFTTVPTFDGGEYICNTCHLKLKKGKIPCQAVFNRMEVDEISLELDRLRKLESVLIAQRLAFQKIVVMPKGQEKKRGHL